MVKNKSKKPRKFDKTNRQERIDKMEEIIQEKISADHLLYVSLKYTKTPKTC